jgi:uncharacterized membrane protein YsdA (DUF1294 family)
MRTNRAKGAVRAERSGLKVSALIALGLLLVMPAGALTRLASQTDWRALFGAPLALSVLAFFAYRRDKRSAEGGKWRVPESTLHLLALIGGWPGGFLAQQLFRHKTSKASFQIVFWTVVLLHQLVAVDSLLGWRFTREVVRVFASRTP